MFKTIFIAILFQWGISANSLTNCDDNFNVLGVYSYHQFPLDEDCLISIHPMNAYQDLIYRDFLVTSSGEIMIFNSYGEGPTATHTGARMFMIFPRSNTIDLAFSEEKVTLTMKQSEVRLIFSRLNLNDISADGLNIKIDPTVSRDNMGGVELYNIKKGLILDSGFRMGEDPRSNLSNKSEFKDSSGNICTIQNSYLFSFDPDGNVKFKFNDKDLSAYLKKICENLRFEF